MTDKSYNLVQGLKDAEQYSSAILGSFQFGGQFFEETVLPSIHKLQVGNTVVLVDTQAYDSTTGLRNAGQTYYLDQVQSPGFFHPKFSVLLGHHRGLAIIGSANLTESGWKQNAELVTTLQYDRESPDEANARCFAQLQEFLTTLAARDRIPGQTTRAAIEDAFDDAPWLPENSTGPTQETPRLIHNLSTPILPEVLDTINQETLERVTVVSPFYSGDNTAVLEALWEAEPSELVLNLQPETVAGFQSESLQQGTLEDASIRVQGLTMDGDDERYIHGKLIVFEHMEGAWALFGSPNATETALLADSTAGNVELAVLQRADSPTYFDYLLDTDRIQTDERMPADIKYRPTTSTEPANEVDFRVLDARVTDDSILIIQYEDTGVTPDTVLIRHDSDTIQQEVQVRPSEPGEVRVTDSDVIDECKQASQVALQETGDSGSPQSNWRWVALPTLEEPVRLSELETIKASKGRHGLLDILNRLRGLDSFYTFLKEVDFAAGRVGGVSVTPTGSDPNSEADAGGMQPRNRTPFDELIEDQIESFYEGMADRSSPPDDDESWTERFQELVNLYLGGCKLTIWWAEQDTDAVPELRRIRTSTEHLESFVRMMRLGMDGASVRQLESDHDLIEHVTIIIYLVDTIQTQAGFPDGPNKHVYDVFRDTHQSALETLVETHSEPIFAADRIQPCLDEYNGLQTRLPSARHIKKFGEELAGIADK